MITFTQILACHGTVIYQTSNNQLSFLTSGRLSVLLAYDGMILLKLDDFEYGINQQTTIIYDDKDLQFSFVFYLPKYPVGSWILKINENADSVYSCLNQKCYLKNKNEQQKNQIVVQNHVKVQPKVSHQINVVNGLTVQKQTSDTSIWVGASKQINKGFGFAGNLLSKGFQNLGGIISKQIKKQQKPTEISQNTKQNLKTIKAATNKVFTFTSEQVGKLFNYGKKVAQVTGEKFEKSETGQQISKNENYEMIKNGAKTGVKVIANVYDGVVNAVYSIGSGVAKGTTKIIGVKYGNEAENAANQAFQGAGNIVKVLRIPEDQAAKTLKQ